MKKTERMAGKEKRRFAAMAVLLIIACGLTYYFHIVVKISIIFSHYFYIPIFFAALWWKRKGLIIPIFLSGLLIFTHEHPFFAQINYEDYFRALMFIVIGSVFTLLSEKIANSKAKIEHLNAVLKAIRNVGQYIVNEKDRDRLLRGVCDSLVETHGFDSVWVLLLDGSGGVETTAESGWGENFLSLRERLRRGALPRCAQKALGQPGIVTNSNPKSFCPDCPLSNVYPGRGAMTVRLEYGGRVYGVLTNSAPANFITEPEVQDLFREIAGDIAFALHNLGLEAERKKAEEIIKKERSEVIRFKTFLESVINNIDAGLIVMDNEKIVLALNQSGRKILEIPEGEVVVGKMIKEISPDLAVLRNIGSSPRDLDKLVALANGKNIPIGFTSSEIQSPEGQKAGIVTLFRNMTEIREREKKFLEREKLAGVGEIAGGIAHEIRNPLFAISSGIQVLENELGLNKSQKEILDIIFSESMRVDHLVRQLLSYGHRDFQGFSPADLSLEEVTEEVERLNLGFLRAREISLRRVIAPGLPRLKVDRDQFIQVLLNLVHNAFDVSKTGQEITLEGSLNRGKNKIKIEVRDQGPGVPEELRDRIFDLFFTTKKGSSGMGLAVSRRIVLDHGGDIRVEQGKDGGAVFIVELPVAKTIGKTE